jgi:tetratricopeptide (TPR) repeat protein
MLLRITTTVVILAALVLPASIRAEIKGNAASQALVDEGNRLYGQRKINEALAKYTEAAKADPRASSPMALISGLYLGLASGPDAARYFDAAEQAALDALRIDLDDPMAQEVLRHVRDGGATPLHTPNEPALRLFHEGENLFAQRRYDEALTQYKAAMQADPAYSSPWTMAGDCYYVQDNFKDAETYFRKATQIEPLNGQAWRFLADALTGQKRFDEAEAALLHGIAAHPGQLPTWTKLSRMQHPDLPVVSLGLRRRGSDKVDAATGKVEIIVDSLQEEESLESLFWLGFSISNAGKKDADKTPLSPFRLQLANWNSALEMAAEISEKDGSQWKDPALRTMARIARDGQLEAALLLLTYKESYRPELEEWKRRNPGGIKLFITRYGVRP